MADPDPAPPDEPEVEPFKPLKQEPEEKPKRKRSFSLLGFLRNETTRRVLWALPWVLFAIIIVAVGDVLFAAALAVLGILGLREFFTMTARAKPFAMPAYLTLAGMVVAAHFGSSFQVLLAAACGFIFAIVSFILGGVYLIHGLVAGTSVPGWTTLVVLSSVFNGVTIALLSMLGEYVVRTLNAVSAEDTYHVVERVKR